MAKQKVQTYPMPSSTRPDVNYTVAEWDDGSFSCDCPRWRFQKGETRNCPHVIAIQTLRGRGASVEQAAQVVPAPGTVRRFRGLPR